MMAHFTRRDWLTLTGAGAAAAGWSPLAHADGNRKVLRYALRVAETTFDPVQVQDVYSLIPLEHILESLYTYDHLARPVRLKPLTAAGMPEPTSSQRVGTAIEPDISALNRLRQSNTRNWSCAVFKAAAGTVRHY